MKFDAEDVAAGIMVATIILPTLLISFFYYLLGR